MFKKKTLPVLMFIIITGCSQATNNTDGTSDTNTLRHYASLRGINIGAAVSSSYLNESMYALTLYSQFDMVTAEWEMKFSPVQDIRSNFNYSGGDAIVNFALAHNMKVRGHALIWHQAVPVWLTNKTWTSNELDNIMKYHISNVVTHFKGKLACWDVVNEAIDDNSPANGLRKTFWYNIMGPGYIDQAFRYARQFDSNVLLFYNDYSGEGLNSKADAIYSLVTNMLARGVPIDGVGLQMHIDTSGYPTNNNFLSNISRFTALGLKVHITELDVRIPIPASSAELTKQAQIYHDLMALCLQNTNVTAFVMWGFTDKYSWVPDFFNTANGYSTNYGAALPFDENYNKKPAYNSLLNALKGY